MPDVQNLERNSRVRVNDVTVGTVTNIALQGWHALVTMTIDGGVDLPANATATIGQTSLLGSIHIELAPPTGSAPQGKLKNGSLIPLSSGGCLSVDRTDPGRGIAAAQWRRPRPDPRHHRGVEHRLHRSRAGFAKPSRTAG